MTKSSVFGNSVRLREDLRLITGKGRYLDDLVLPGMLHAGFARSLYAHARLRKVTVARDAGSRGVRCVLTGADVERSTEPFPHLANPVNAKIPRYYCMPAKKVRFVGEPVVAFAFEDRYGPEDAEDLVTIEYEELKPVLDPEEALRTEVNIHDEVPGNLYARVESEHGDVDTAFRGSHLVISERFAIDRQLPAPMEPHGCIADYDSSTGILKVWSSTQIPHDLRSILAMALRLDESKIEVRTGDIGGGFGSYKYHPEDILVALLSMRTGKPVKWVASRREIFLAGYQAREQLHRVKIGVAEDGKILALEDDIVACMGAYLPRETVGPPFITSVVLPGPYKIPNVRVRLSCAAVNKAPLGAYRGFGQPQANFVMERLVDAAADALGLDPVEMRYRNFVKSVDFPYSSPTGLKYDTGDYAACLRKAVRLSGYKGGSAARSGKRRRVRRGFGVAFYVEVTNYSFPHSKDTLTVRLEKSGRISVLTGLTPHGQGTETMVAQVAAYVFGIGTEDIDVTLGDTTRTPYSQGTFGSRSSTLASDAILGASQGVIEEARRLAAASMGVAEASLIFAKGRFVSRGRRQGLSLKEVAEDLGPQEGIESSIVYGNRESAVSYGTHIAVVDFDEETGSVSIPKYVVVHDCGVEINPAEVEAQIHGGLMQGLGGALFEEVAYDENGQLLTSGFMDYLIPCSVDLPPLTVEHTSVRSSVNLLGTKGVGESGIIPVYAAIANALADAGVPAGGLSRIPLKSQRVWDSLRGH